MRYSSGVQPLAFDHDWIGTYVNSPNCDMSGNGELTEDEMEVEEGLTHEYSNNYRIIPEGDVSAEDLWPYRRDLDLESWASLFSFPSEKALGLAEAQRAERKLLRPKYFKELEDRHDKLRRMHIAKPFKVVKLPERDTASSQQAGEVRELDELERAAKLSLRISRDKRREVEQNCLTPLTKLRDETHQRTGMTPEEQGYTTLQCASNTRRDDLRNRFRNEDVIRDHLRKKRADQAWRKLLRNKGPGRNASWLRLKRQLRTRKRENPRTSTSAEKAELETKRKAREQAQADVLKALQHVQTETKEFSAKSLYRQVYQAEVEKALEMSKCTDITVHPAKSESSKPIRAPPLTETTTRKARGERLDNASNRSHSTMTIKSIHSDSSANSASSRIPKPKIGKKKSAKASSVKSGSAGSNIPKPVRLQVPVKSIAPELIVDEPPNLTVEHPIEEPDMFLEKKYFHAKCG